VKHHHHHHYPYQFGRPGRPARRGRRPLTIEELESLQRDLEQQVADIAAILQRRRAGAAATPPAS
jgi:hypothetical protein